MEQKAMPDFKAFTVIERSGQKNIWVDVGVGFVHGDGAGINVLLQAMPLDGKIVLRPYSNEGQGKQSPNR